MDDLELTYDQMIMHELVKTVFVREASKIFGCQPNINRSQWYGNNSDIVEINYKQKVGKIATQNLYLSLSVKFDGGTNVNICGYERTGKFDLASPKSKTQLELFIKGLLKTIKRDCANMSGYALNKLGYKNK